MARRCSTVCLPFDQGAYPEVVADPAAFRAALDGLFLDSPELFPEGFGQGYRLKESRTSRKLGLAVRRVRLKATGESFTVRPSFALPYMAGWAADAFGPLFLRAFGVPFWALAFVFGRDPMYWYRLEVALGRNSVAGTTLRRAPVPEHLLADEHHQPRDGEKNYIATTVAADCCLGAALAQTAATEDLQEAYGVFGQEAQDVQPGYAPVTVSVDGWASTHQAWLMLFPLAVLLRCFLHGWLNIRSRGKLSEAFVELSGKVWHAYHAPDRRSFAQRLRRLWEWARGQALSAWLLEQVQKLCGRSKEYAKAYSHPGGHRTSNMLDRVMRGALQRNSTSGTKNKDLRRFGKDLRRESRVSLQSRRREATTCVTSRFSRKMVASATRGLTTVESLIGLFSRMRHDRWFVRELGTGGIQPVVTGIEGSRPNKPSGAGVSAHKTCNGFGHE